MESALSWLGDIARGLLRFIPRVEIIAPTHEAVKFIRGGKVKKIESGRMSMYWPLTTEFHKIPVRRQTVNLVTQYLVTRDDKTVALSGIVVYEVTDVVKLLTETYDYDDTIIDFSLASIKEVVCKSDYEEIKNTPIKIDDLLKKKLEEELEYFGIKVVKVTLTDLVPCKVIATLGMQVNNHLSSEE